MRERVNPKKINSKLKDLQLMKEVATAWSKESMEAQGKKDEHFKGTKKRESCKIPAHKWGKKVQGQREASREYK